MARTAAGQGSDGLHGPAALLVALALGVTVGCSGCAISPKPEPPGPGATFDLGQVTTRETGGLGPKAIEGGPGAAGPAGAIVRAFNLEMPDDPVEAVIQPDGSFAIEMLVFQGNEVRIQVIAGEERSEPVDFVVGPDDTTPVLAQRALGHCLLLEPAAQIDMAVGQLVLVSNHCADSVTIEAPYVRRPVTGLEVGTGGSWPATLAPQEQVAVSVQFEAPDGTIEEIVFVEASAPAQDRRPITVLPHSP